MKKVRKEAMKNARRFMVYVVCVIIFFPLITYAGDVKEQISVYMNYVNLQVNGQLMDVDNFVLDGTTYIPIRSVAEALGKNVTWDQDTKTAGVNDFPFLLVDDDMVSGVWESIDFVNNYNEFEVGERLHKGSLYMTGMTFSTDGKLGFEIEGKQMSLEHTYVDDVVIHSDETVNRYYIMQVDDVYYMFYEWDHSDGIYKDMSPEYYVLRKVENWIVTGLETNK